MKTQSTSIWAPYESLRPNQIDELRKQYPVAYVPWGALEYHGVHAAVGLDGTKARGLCEALAREVGGLVLPTVWHAASTIKTLTQFPHQRHSIDHREETLRLLAEDILHQLLEEGFDVVVLLTGHVGEPHHQILRETGERVAQNHPGKHVFVWAETGILPTEELTVNHAGLGEVSFLMHFAPTQVDLSLLPSGRDPTLAEDAVLGPNPATATAALGERLTGRFVELAAARIRAVLPSV